MRTAHPERMIERECHGDGGDVITSKDSDSAGIDVVVNGGDLITSNDSDSVGIDVEVDGGDLTTSTI